jgi:hypothetical protein
MSLVFLIRSFGSVEKVCSQSAGYSSAVENRSRLSLFLVKCKRKNVWFLLCLIKHHLMKAVWGSGCVNSTHHSHTARCVVCFTARALCSGGESLTCPLGRPRIGLDADTKREGEVCVVLGCDAVF